MVINDITIKNFLSYGNAPITFNFNKGQVSVITGKNGSGKSTLIEAIYFVLTGKPYRDVNKGDLVNTTNKKDCLVELSFDINETPYFLRRGIKPNLFEIYKGGRDKEHKIDEEAHSKDYQEVLEGITGLSPSIIKQILIISNRFYTPFLELEAKDKRQFIETILGITLLSEMNDNIKKRLTTIKQDELFIEKDIERINSNIELINEFIEKESSSSEDRKLEINGLIRELENDITLSTITNTELEEDLKKHKENRKELRKYLDYKDKVVNSLANINAEMNRVNKDIQFYSKGNVCPTCKQEIKDSEERLNQAKKELESLNEKKKISDGRMEKIKNAEKSDMEIQDFISKLQLQISKNEILSNNNVQKIVQLKAELNKVVEVGSDNQLKLDLLNTDKDVKINDKIVLTNEKKNVTIVQKLISDKGIKRYIINKYVPVLNSYVNKYLETLEAKYKVIFNDELEEKIVSKNAGDSYGAFSSGEKQRCDLALMFSFLEISKLKNNVNCNLICFDETFSDMDETTGLEKIFDLFKSKDYSINFITHDERFKELADITYLATKQRFTKLEMI